MPQPTFPGDDQVAAPRFYLTPRRSLSPAVLCLAAAIALGSVFAALHLRSRSHKAVTQDDDDLSRVDTIYLGDPRDAPVATRPPADPRTGSASVHPFIVVHLPRSGDQFGQIPDTPAGRLLYRWLAAFNGSDLSALDRVLPTSEPGLVQAAQRRLRTLTGGLTLVSAREVAPGVLVFRVHDQTSAATEALGTLQVTPDGNPTAVHTFSLRAFPQPQSLQPEPTPVK